MSHFINIKPKKKGPARIPYKKTATIAQMVVRNNVVNIAKAYRCQPTKLLLDKLAELGYYPAENRIYKSGGVGSWYWLPKFGIYRIQVRRSHISTKTEYMPYALCVEV